MVMNYVLLPIAAVFVGIFFYILTHPKHFRQWLDQTLTDRKRIRAHEGRVVCETSDCDNISIALTPNGYFCEEHWEAMEKKKLPNGGYTIWNHVLYHYVRKNSQP